MALTSVIDEVACAARIASRRKTPRYLSIFVARGNVDLSICARS